MILRRGAQALLAHHLGRGKSILLLGPRQTGKTTLTAALRADLRISLASASSRQQYEQDPAALASEVEALPRGRKTLPLVVVDEVQKAPGLLDVSQDLIDRRLAQFVFTGSSARKLRRGQDVNLLPGRVVALRLDPLMLEEEPRAALSQRLLFGALPAIRTAGRDADREADLRSYVETYLEEEIRQEALVRNVGAFGRFLELAALSSGAIVNYTKVSQDVGVSAVTIQAYYEILVDCLVAERVEPLTRSESRKKLTKASRYLLFDMGVRRLAAREGTHPHPTRLGELFEQFVALELIWHCRLHVPRARVMFWRDPDGPEVDWLVAADGSYLPIEAKLTASPSSRDARHLRVFMDEYGSPEGLVVCTAPRPARLAPGVTAIPWQTLPDALRERLPPRASRSRRGGPSS